METPYPAVEKAYALADVVLMVDNRGFLKRLGEGSSVSLSLRETGDKRGLGPHFENPWARLIKFPMDAPLSGKWDFSMDVGGKAAGEVRRFSANYEISTFYLQKPPGGGFCILRIGELDQDELASLIAGRKAATVPQVARKYREADWSLYSLSREKMFAGDRNALGISYARDLLSMKGSVSREDLARVGIQGRWLKGRLTVKATQAAAEGGGEDMEIETRDGKTILSEYAGLIDGLGKRGRGHLSNRSVYDSKGKLLEEQHRDQDDSR
jgi:hypothetical protein